MKRIELFENGLFLTFDIDDNGGAGLVHLSALPFDEALFRTGESSFPASRPQFADFSDAGDQTGRLLTLSCTDRGTGAPVTTKYRFFNGIPAVKIYAENGSPDTVAAAVIRSADTELLCAADNMSRGILHDRTRGEFLAWQSNRAALDRSGDRTVLKLFSRSEDEPCICAVSAEEDGLNGVIGAMTRCFRAMRRRTRDSKTLGVFFDGSCAPAEETLKLMHAVAGTGCVYYSISAGLSQRSLSELAIWVYGHIMTPGCVIPADTPAETLGSIAKEYRFAKLTLTGAKNAAALASRAAEVISLRRDIIIESSVADMRTVSLGLLHSTPCLTVDDLLLAPPEQTVVVCDVDNICSPAELIAALTAALPARLCITGRLDKLHPKIQLLVEEAVAVLKRIRSDTAAGLPIIAGGVNFGSVSADGHRIYIAVSRRSENMVLPLPRLRGKSFSARCIFPQSFSGSTHIADGVLHIAFGLSDSAGLFLLEAEAIPPASEREKHI